MEIPHSNQYRDPNFVPNVRFSNNVAPAFGSPLKPFEREIKRFDGHMHGRMTVALTAEDWIGITDDLIKASSISWKEVGGLRNAVKNRFLEECPDPELRKRLNQALAPKKSGAIRHSFEQEQAAKRAASAAKKAARSQRDQAERAIKKTSSGGGQKPGKQGKGGKKN